MRYTIFFIIATISTTLYGQLRTDTLLSQLNDLNSNKIFVVSHRGDWRNAPENSLQSIQNCIDLGVDMVEIDLKKTKDGHLILMHDKLIDRTTTGKGSPSDYTLEEIKRLKLRNGAGHRTYHTVPTLEEAMNLAKGKILVNIDKGYDYFDDVYKILERTGTVEQCIIKADKPYDIVKSEKPIALKRMLFMPVIKLTGERAEFVIREYQQKNAPALFELVFDSDDEKVLSLINLVRKGQSRIFINSLWPELCGGHHDDRAVEQGEIDKSWGWIIKRGASLIQTDRPALLLEYLRSQGLHE